MIELQARKLECNIEVGHYQNNLRDQEDYNYYLCSVLKLTDSFDLGPYLIHVPSVKENLKSLVKSSDF